MSISKNSTNLENLTDEQVEQRIAEKMQAARISARRNRNYDRAVTMVAALVFNGVIVVNTDQDLSTDIDLIGNAIKSVLAMLEAFELDSPKQDITDPFGWLK